MQLLVFGFGFTGQALARRLTAAGWQVAGTSRSVQGRAAMQAMSVAPVDPADGHGLRRAVRAASAVLIAAPPNTEGCPGLRALSPVLKSPDPRPSWIGYLSTTGVYGDQRGGWVFERSPLAPRSPEGERRAIAERDWSAFAQAHKLNVSIFRLPGIYGPGRSALDRVRAGDARRIVKPGHVFSRIHVNDLAAALDASISRAGTAGVYNLCDDEPCPAAEVTLYAAQLLRLAPPPEQTLDQAALSPMATRFWAESKRVSNARAKAVLGWRPAYPSYREGLAAVLAAEALGD